MTKNDNTPTSTRAPRVTPDAEPPDAEDLARFRDFMRAPVVINLEEGTEPSRLRPAGEHQPGRAERSAEMVRPRTGPPFKVAIW